MLCVLRKVKEMYTLSKDTYYGNLYTWFDGPLVRKTNDVTRAQFYDSETAEKYSENDLYEVVTLSDAETEELRTYYERKIEECRKQLEDIDRILSEDNK